jgi:hypothetical protein
MRFAIGGPQHAKKSSAVQMASDASTAVAAPFSITVNFLLNPSRLISARI